MRNRIWGWIGMYEDDCFATLKFFKDRLQNYISQVHAPGVCEDNETIESKDVECVRQLFQRGVDIRQRETSKTRKAVRSLMKPRAGVEPARPYGQRILSPLKSASLSLTKRYEPVFTGRAVVKVSLRLVSYQHVSPSS